MKIKINLNQPLTDLNKSDIQTELSAYADTSYFATQKLLQVELPDYADRTFWAQFGEITEITDQSGDKIDMSVAVVTKKQFFDWLIANRGYDMDDVIAMVAVHITDPIEFKTVKNAIKNALVYKKDDPNVAKIALMLGMTDLIDTIFAEAAGL